MGLKLWLAEKAALPAVSPVLTVIKAVVSILGGVRATVWFVFMLVFLLTAKAWQHKAHDLRADLDAAKAGLAIERAEHEALVRQLADAKGQAEQAKAEKDAALKAAAKRLAAREKEWRRIYGAKPENRAWAETPIPPDILGNLSK